MTASDPRVSRLVVRVPNWLGDVVMALPAIAAVRRGFPDAHLAVAAIAAVAPVFEESTDAAQQQIVRVDRRGELQQLREHAFDATLLLTNSFRSAWIARRAAIRQRWGYGTNGRSLLLTRAIRRPRGERHQSEYYLEIVRGLGLHAESALPRIRTSERTRGRAAALLAQHGLRPGVPIVGFAPGAAYGHAKRWPPERVAAVIVRLVRERGAQCLVVGAEGDRPAGREIESSLPPDIPVANLIGRTDLRLLMGVLGACSAFVSNDSGAMHLAAAVGIPVTALFGPTKERATAPLGEHDVLVRQVFCRPCMLRECPIDHRCMRRIAVDDVFASVARRLDSHA